jgi:hypothetical protein
MAMGSYFIGATVRVPLQVTEDGMAIDEDVSPKVKKIVRPNGTSVYSSSKNMSVLSEEDSAYYFDYIPDIIGDYVVIMTYTLEGVEFTVIENFTVSSLSNITTAPRAESR